MQHSPRHERIRASLEAAFTPSTLTVTDQSAQHVGHAGAADVGETHYDVTIVSSAFAGQNRVARSRAVHDVLAPEFANGLHAISLTLNTPDEV
jgi:BolA protein